MPTKAKRTSQAKHAIDPSSPETVLTKSQANREILQDFVPLAESLEWELGQQYLRDRGNKAFISDASPVPFVINNDGTLSRQAAEVFFASLVEAEKTGPLEEDIFVLELGIGVGLFARYFLDNFRDLCARQKKDYYDRLCYIAADKSRRMLLDVLRHGVLANHPGRYRVREVDALCPETLLRDLMFYGCGPRPLRGVFLNYLLDCLPAAVLELEADQVRQLCVRTCLGRNVNLEHHTDMRVDALRERANSADPRAKEELLEVYGLFASEYDYRPVDVRTLPHGEFAFDYGQRRTRRVLHSYGAIQCLDKLLGMVSDDGFILINDYGQTQTSRDEEIEHQRFSLATFVGVNFALLKAYFDQPRPLTARPAGGAVPELTEVASSTPKCQMVEPSGEEKGIHSRLLGSKLGSDTKTRFFELFATAEKVRLEEPVTQAHAFAKAGRFELTASFYNEALRRQPRNWVLLNEISMFLTFQMRDPRAGADMAKLALALNPTCSAELWNTLGDALYEFGRTAEARSAYQKALAVNSSDVRSRYNLAWVHARERNYSAALTAIADALSFDKTGQFRDRLLQKQQEVLGQLTNRNQHEYLLLINLISKYAKPSADSRVQIADCGDNPGSKPEAQPEN